MKQNIGGIDKLVRVLASMVLVAVGYLNNMWVLYIFAGVLLLTAATGMCCMYVPFGINTNHVTEKKSETKAAPKKSSRTRKK
ncbi:MAG: DUF2892 domain-containing protein [archaeon]